MIRERKRHFSQQQLREMAFPIISRLLSNEEVAKANTLLLYHALPDEVPTDILLDTLLQRGKTILLPRVISDTDMSIHRYTCENDLTTGSYGILEPSGDIYHGDIDLAIIPGMAFDTHNHRLGRGKGYYDRFLSLHPYIYKIGICFPFQFIDSIPVEPTDIAMDICYH